MTMKIWDMHVHLDFMRSPRTIAEEAAAIGLGIYSATVTPDGYEKTAEVLKGLPNVKVGAGLHPWWAADGRCGMEDAKRAAEFARSTRYVGEIGLDASNRVPEGSLERQEAIFRTICTACAETSSPADPKILTIHSVQAGNQVLDILEQTGCLERCRCIFHWYTGSGDALTRAVKAGCLFSVNGLMLGTRRGREYARQIPAKQLLTETDLPAEVGDDISARQIADSIEGTLGQLAIIRGTDMHGIILENCESLMA